MYGWTKKYKEVTVQELIDMIREDGFLHDQKVLYFKYIVKTELATHERRSSLLKEDKK